MSNNEQPRCHYCREPMEWKEGETDCDMCGGEGLTYHDADQVVLRCQWCRGNGTMDVEGWFCDNPDCG